MTVYDLQAKITLNSSQFNKGLQDAGKQMSSFAQQVSDFTGKLAELPGKISHSIDAIGQNVQKAGSFISGVGTSLDNKITKPAMGAAAAVSGIFLAKGWGRLTQIDEAKAKLRGLGNDAEDVKNIMDSALASVKGTAFGMDEAATTAASAVAAGIQQGEDLTKYLTTIGDAAAIAGTSMGDMGYIFNKVVTAGKAQNDVLGSLADKGIPIYQWLAEETGHAADEIFEMAKNGEIDLATFRAAVEKHVGGAAKELGNATLTGALANVWAAVSRVGANFLGAADDADSFAGKLLPVIIGVQDKLGVLEEKAKEWGKVFGEIFGAFVDYFSKGEVEVDKLGDAAKKVWSVVQPILDKAKAIITFIKDQPPELVAKIAGLVVGLGPLLKYGGQIVQIMGLILSNGGLVIAGISLLVGALGYFTEMGMDTTGIMQKMLDGISGLGDKFKDVSEKIKDGLSRIWGMVPEILDSALDVGADIVKYLLDGLTSDMSGIMEAAGDIITSLMSNITEHAPDLIESASNVIGSFLNGIAENLPRLFAKGSEMLTTIANSILENADTIAEGGLAVINGIADGIITHLPELLSSATEILTTIMNGISENAPDLLNTGIDIVTQLVTGIAEALPTLIPTAIDTLLTLIQDFLNGDGLSKIADAAVSLITNLADGIAAAIPVIVEKLPDILWQLLMGIVDNAPKIAEAVLYLITTLGSALLEVGGDLLDKGKELGNSLFGGFIEKITEKFSEIKQIITDSEIYQSFADLWESVKALFEVAWGFLTGWWSILFTFFKTEFSIMKTGIVTAFTWVKTSVETWLTAISLPFRIAFEGIKQAALLFWSLLKNAFVTSCNIISNVIKAFLALIKGDWSGALNHMKDAATAGLKGIHTVFHTVVNTIQNLIKNVIKTAKDWGKDLISSFVSGIKSKISSIGDAIREVAEKIWNLMHFSEPEEGPLKDFHTYAPDMMELFAQGIKDNTKLVTDQLEKSFDFSDVIADQNVSVSGSGGNSINGGVVINVYGAEGQNINELADEISYRLQHLYDVAGAVYA